ncbi:precorrin-2 dehydrogenase/sirohydrochlorin ferrochelatase family protein [Pseudobutyrivibrio xylanivorans]|uniref:precorrin-2 dehydrogenase n=1 Tax=Pseudobutyrivibrio xylanivorans TaxID=185007 RepID=A0A5P6VTN4_PSEXY|nr:bifunctional precorrin-2 dehydrogenase/sirohydrochlorin ferrochelatase [Pseudobutyrivibrio xylanivorans]QFJ54564.1 bifunctional precorrin-2 dehydrogenase/sirohydrochlorin ferrochelatase [Pseudobutyrivibrio xylanivorans]
MAYFPMFVDLTDSNCLVIGGGEVALRKVNVLLDFGAKVHVIAKEIGMGLAALSEETDHLVLEQRDFTPFDLQDRKLVVSATDDSELNAQVSAMCKEGKIPVNVVDNQALCTFIFPSYLKEQNLVGAFCSSGNSPSLTQFLRNKEKEVLTPKLGELNEMLGRWRQPIMELFPDEAPRRSAFEQLIDYALCYDGVPTDEEVEELLMSISMTL